jgi:hypothetical protein
VRIDFASGVVSFQNQVQTRGYAWIEGKKSVSLLSAQPTGKLGRKGKLPRRGELRLVFHSRLFNYLEKIVTYKQLLPL